MRILVSNDDGIDSPGIQVLAKALGEIAEVTVVAPHQEQSAVGHSITMQTPLRITEHYRDGSFFGYAVNGTPADCVKIGIRNIMRIPPDLVVSGINHGSNTAISIIYSGTVSAAREAAIMDIPSMAVSICSYEAKNFDFAGKVAQIMAPLVLMKGNDISKGTLLNINIPDIPAGQIKGFRLTKQGKSRWDDFYEERQDPYGRNYYWLKGELVEVDKELDTDQFAVKNDYVSVTPIHFDLTDYETYNKMKNWQLEELIYGTNL
ncbi:MAG: 5'/3'-nucleotidase SurE [Ignavibacteria bacterium]